LISNPSLQAGGEKVYNAGYTPKKQSGENGTNSPPAPLFVKRGVTFEGCWDEINWNIGNKL